MTLSKALLGGLAASSVLLSATLARAHAQMVWSSPAANTTVASPNRVELRFDDPLVRKGSTFQLYMTTRQETALPAPETVEVVPSIGAGSKTLTATLLKPLAAGTYLVSWHAVTADGGRTNGTFTFMVR